MAKKSMVDKNKKRLAKGKLHFVARRKFSEMAKSGSLSMEEALKIMKILDSSAGASYIKYRNRCPITGRPRGFRGLVGLSKGVFRDRASFGLVMGFKKI